MLERKFSIGILDFDLVDHESLIIEPINKKKLIEISNKYDRTFSVGYFVGTLMGELREALQYNRLNYNDFHNEILKIYKITYDNFVAQYGREFEAVFLEFDQYLDEADLKMTRNIVSWNEK